MPAQTHRHKYLINGSLIVLKSFSRFCPFRVVEVDPDRGRSLRDISSRLNSEYSSYFHKSKRNFYILCSIFINH